MGKSKATQTIKMDVRATEQTFEKLFDHIFDGDDAYEVTFVEELEVSDADGTDTTEDEFNLYRVTWSISGWTYFCRSNDWYSPDEWDCSEEFVFDNSDVRDIINSYAKDMGIDTDLYDIENIRIGDVEGVDDYDYD